MPSVVKISSVDPITTRGRASALVSVRISRTAVISSTIGSTTAAMPMTERNAQSNQCPTGPPARHQTPAAAITAVARKISASPSRRCAGSICLVLPNARTTPPMPRARPPPLARDLVDRFGAGRRGACVDPARGLALSVLFRPVLFRAVVFRAVLDLAVPPLRAAEPLRLVALLLRAEPRPPFDVRLAMPHTVSSPASRVTPATGDHWSEVFSGDPLQPGHRAWDPQSSWLPCHPVRTSRHAEPTARDCSGTRRCCGVC